MNKKVFHHIFKMLFGMLLVMLLFEVPAQAKTYRLNKKVYSRVKGCWWTNVSSAGYNVKFTKTKMKYYDRKSNKVVKVAKIRGCKNYKNGYLIKVQDGKYKYSYHMYKRKYKNILEYYDGWKRDGKRYSGSSSLMRGKWK